MYVSFHSAIGASVALSLFPGNWPLAFLAGWFGHYLADAIPHGDDASPELLADRRRLVRRAAAWGAGDLAVLGTLTVWWTVRHGFSPTLAAAVIGSSLPDLMWGLEAVLNRSLFGWFARFHKLIHNPLKIQLPLWFGLSYQLVGAGLLWWRLLI